MNFPELSDKAAELYNLLVETKKRHGLSERVFLKRFRK